MKKIVILLLSLFIFSSVTHSQNSKIPQFVKSYAGKHQFNGTILIQEDGHVIYHQSFGLADRSFNVPVTNETEYKIASVTKTFTAVLILELYEQGKIDLNKTINAYLPGYKGEAGDKVTIHQLLNHTSGMQNTDTVSSMENALRYGIGFYQKPYTSEQVLTNFCSYPLINKPGEKFNYNNGEYVILGKILEAIYKQPYETILTQRLLTPLKMSHSGLLAQSKMISNLAPSYFLGANKQLEPDLPAYIENWYAAGAMYSCTADLLKFYNALFGLKLIKKSTLDLMTKPGLDNYGYSVWIRDTEGANVKYKRVERYGSIMGANAVLFRYMNKDLTIIILSNTNQTDLGDYALQIGKLIF